MAEQQPDVPEDLQAQIDTVQSIEESDSGKMSEEAGGNTPGKAVKRPLWRQMLSRKAFAIYLVIACVSYPLVGFYGVPALIKQFILPDLNRDIRGAIYVERIEVNPYTFRMVMSGIELADESGVTITTCQRFVGDLEFASLWRGQGIILKQVLIEKPDLKLVLAADGTLNALHALEPLEPRLPEIKTFELPYMTIEDCQVTSASYHFKDDRLDFEHAASEIQLVMKDFTSAENVFSPLQIKLETELKEAVAIDASICAKPIGIKGALTLNQAKLAHYYPYVKYLTEDKLKVALPAGILDLALNWEVDLMADTPKVNLRLPSLTLSDLHLQHELKSDVTTLARLKRIEVRDVDVDAIAHKLVVGEVKVNDGYASAELLKDGSLDILALLKPFMVTDKSSYSGRIQTIAALPETAKEEAGLESPISSPIPDVIPVEAVREVLAVLAEVKAIPTQFVQLNISQRALALAEEAVTNPWHLEVTHTKIDDQSFDLTDHMSGVPLPLSLRSLAIELAAITSENGFKLPVQLSGKLATAKLNAKGTVDPLKQMALLDVEANELDITPFMPYVRQHAYVDVNHGLLSAKGKVTAHLKDPKTGGLSYGFTGDATLDGLDVLATLPEKKPAPLLKLKSITVNEVKAAGPVWQLAASKIMISEPDLKAELKSDGSLAILDLVKKPVTHQTQKTQPASLHSSLEASLHSSPSSAKPAIKLPVELALKSIQVSGGKVHFQDHMQTPTFAMDLNKLDVTLGGLNVTAGVDFEEQGVTLPVRLSTEVDGAPLTAEGEVDLGRMKARLKVSANELAIPPFMAYASEYVNANLQQGKLTATGLVKADLNDQETGLSYGFEGDVAIDDFKLLEASDDSTDVATTTQEPVISFQSLAVSQVKASGPKWLMHADRVSLVNPQIRAELTKEGTPAMLSMLKFLKEKQKRADDKTGLESAPVTRTVDLSKASILPPMTLPVDLLIKDVSIQDGLIELKDHSQSPVFASSLSKLNVAIGPIHGTPEEMADFKISGYIAGKGALSLQGRGAPLDLLRDTTAKMSLNEMPLLPFDPFTRRYAGYTVDKGEVSELSSDVTIQNGLMEISNSLVLGSVYFGDKVKSDEAINAPLKMGMALLRDKDDRIVLAIPLHGDLNNPKFKIIPVIKSAITERLKQVAAAPFDTLAGAAGMVADASKVTDITKVAGIDTVTGAGIGSVKKFGKMTGIAKIGKLTELTKVSKVVGAQKPDLSYLAFESGTASLSESETQKLGYIVKGMDQRPGIRLAYQLYLSEDEMSALRSRLALKKLSKLSGKRIEAQEGEAYEAALGIYYRSLRADLEDFLKESYLKQVALSEVTSDAASTDSVTLDAEGAETTIEASQKTEVPVRENMPEVLLPDRPLPPIAEIEKMFMTTVKVQEADLEQLKQARIGLFMDQLAKAGMAKRVRMKKGIPAKQLKVPYLVFEIE